MFNLEIVYEKSSIGYRLGQIYVFRHDIYDGKVSGVTLLHKFDAHPKPITGMIINGTNGKELLLIRLRRLLEFGHT